MLEILRQNFSVHGIRSRNAGGIFLACWCPPGDFVSRMNRLAGRANAPSPGSTDAAGSCVAGALAANFLLGPIHVEGRCANPVRFDIMPL